MALGIMGFGKMEDGTQVCGMMELGKVDLGIMGFGKMVLGTLVLGKMELGNQELEIWLVV